MRITLIDATGSQQEVQIDGLCTVADLKQSLQSTTGVPEQRLRIFDQRNRLVSDKEVLSRIDCPVALSPYEGSEANLSLNLRYQLSGGCSLTCCV
ncbi:MAG: hypothetical protein Q8P67_16835, partial [archaeon]|nr:hypothetical protein [archaeon]